MRTVAAVVLVGLAGLIGCVGRVPEADPPRPSGDTSTPDEEFRLAHEAVTRLRQRLVAVRGVPGRPVDGAFAESVALSKELSAAQRQAGRLGYEVGTAEPHTPLGGDALFACLQYSLDPPARCRRALDLAVQHHPDDTRLADYLLVLLGDSPVQGHTWLAPVFERLLAASADSTVRMVARAGRGRLLLLSADPAEVSAGERLLAEVARDGDAGPVVVWAGKVLAEHGRRLGVSTSSPAVRLAP